MAKRKLVVKPSTTKAKIKRVSKTKMPRTSHGISNTWGGASSGFNKNKSKTPLKVDLFATNTDLVLTERALSVLKPIRDKYGKKAWPRNDTDAGIVNAGIIKGVVQHVSGDPTSENCEIKFVGNL